MAGLPYSGARIRDAGAGEIHDGSLRLRSLSVVLDDWCKDRGKHKGEHEELVNCEQCGKEHTIGNSKHVPSRTGHTSFTIHIMSEYAHTNK